MKPNSKLLSAIYLCIAASATADYKAVNPQVAKIVSEVSEQRVTEILKKLESFGTRNTFSFRLKKDETPGARGHDRCRSANGELACEHHPGLLTH